MTTIEFDEKLAKANSIKDLLLLRNEQGLATRFVSRAKVKLAKKLKKAGYSFRTISVSTIAKLMGSSYYSGAFKKVRPTNTKVLSEFNDKNCFLYVESVEGGKFNKYDIYIRECRRK